MGVFGVMCECNIIIQVWELPKTWKNPTEKTWGCVERMAMREREPTGMLMRASIQPLPGSNLVQWGGGGCDA